MSNTLDDIALNEIDCVYAGKNIAQYLQVTVPKKPSKWKQMISELKRTEIDEMVQIPFLLIFRIAVEGADSAYQFVFDRKGYNEQKRSQEEHEQRESKFRQSVETEKIEFEEKLRAAGIITKNERDAYEAARYAGKAMAKFVYNVGENRDGVIVKRKNDSGGEVKITPKLLEDCLGMSVRDGIKCLTEKYWMPTKGVKQPQIINPDFQEKAVSWLINEVYFKTDKNRECKLLERVVIKRDVAGYFNLGLAIPKNLIFK